MNYETFLSYHPNKYLVRLYEIQWQLNKLGSLQLAGDYAYLISYIISEQWDNPLKDSRFLKTHPRGENTYCPPASNCPIPFTRLYKTITNDLYKHNNKDLVITYLKEIYDLLLEYRTIDSDILFTDTIDAYRDYTRNILESLDVSTEVDPWPEPGDYPDLETFNPKVPFCIENVGDTSVEIGIYNQSNSSHATRSDCKISYDSKTWQNYNLITKSSISSDDITDKLLLKNKGDRIYIKADNYVYKENKMGAPHCTRIIVLNAQPSCKIRARGNIASLNHGNNDKYRTNYTKLDSTEEGCFDYLFNRCECLIQAPDLVFMSLSRCCYRSMFYGCTSLTKSPELPATDLANECYYNMFCDCTSLIQAPELPAVDLKQACYVFMFANCISLTQAPELPATTLADGCYRQMFDSCKSLIQAPELLATKLASGCYKQMFKGCTKLNSIKCLTEDISAQDCTIDWLGNVSKTGDFYCLSKTEWSSGENGIPVGWIRHDIE